jgi:hypothetical protein
MKIFAQKDISRKLQVPMKIMYKMVFGAEDNPPFFSSNCYMPLGSILLSHIGVCRTSLPRLPSHYISIPLLDRYRVYTELELTDWNESGGFDLYLKSLRYLPPRQDRAVWKLWERAPPDPREAWCEDRGTIAEAFAST